MDLNGFTPGQRACVTCVNKPVIISAGAGSGKTFTLMQRVAFAFLNPELSGVENLDQIMAITFTEKAAAEIKARVKKALRQEGMNHLALEVDGAWISTIHSMCARILRAHALELGIDPAFEVMPESDYQVLLEQAINDVLEPDNEVLGPRSYQALFNMFPVRSKGGYGDSVASLVSKVLGSAAGQSNDFDDFVLGPQPAAPLEIAKQALLAYESALPRIQMAKQSKTQEAQLTGTEQSIEALQAFMLGEGWTGVDTRAGGPAPTYADALRVLDGCVNLGGNYGSSEDKEVIKAAKQDVLFAANELFMGLGCEPFSQLMELSRAARMRFDQLKRDRGVLDNNDLLQMALVALRDHPEIAQRYANQFKLVMVDEFQDTSQLQIDMIRYLAGENLRHLCTVGDSQQSIYRFRGADVHVYDQHKKEMVEDAGAQFIELDRNFRSHADVLQFVECIFSQPTVFGEGFLHLDDHGEDRANQHWLGKGPRIDVCMVSYPSKGVGIDGAKKAEARAIAKRFKLLKEQGHQAKDMAVLLGTMSRAQVYAQALREEGFECVVTGGSGFGGIPEVRVVSRVAQALASPSNTEALFEVLSGDLFGVSSDDLLLLGTQIDDATGSYRRCDLNDGFAHVDFDQASAPLRLASRVLRDARHLVGSIPLADAVQRVVVESGWLTRLQEGGAMGIATAANVEKAIRLIRAIEEQSALGPVRVAEEFASQLDGSLKEKPGSLVGEESDMVQIMTIHASKGLEFPIVAVAEFAGKTWKAGSLLSHSRVGKTYLSLMGNVKTTSKSAADKRKEYKPELGCSVEDVMPAYAQRLKYEQAQKQEELEEDRRKFYVALTRAREALVVAFSVAASKSKGVEDLYSGVLDDIRTALCGIGDFPEGTALLEYGGTEPAAFERIVLSEGAAGDAQGEDLAGDLGESCAEDSGDTADRLFAVPRYERYTALDERAFSSTRQGVFSYSSLSGSLHEDDDPSSGERDRKPAVVSALVNAGTLSLVLDDEVTPKTWQDADKATDMGSAFHRLGQFAIETGVRPDAKRVDSLAQLYGITPAQRFRLNAALDLWFGSQTYADVQDFAVRRPEVPFFVEIGDRFMEGEIDLLCIDETGRHALIVDYKTGGSDAETQDDIRKKHELQAKCYSYATLLQGYDDVELRFVRVERRGADGQPQEARYRFVYEDLSQLCQEITTLLA